MYSTRPHNTSVIILSWTLQLPKKRHKVRVLKKHIYNSIVIAKLESKSPETLSEIIHRQTKYGHLTIIDDELLKLFLEFDRQIYPHLTSQEVFLLKDSFFQTILTNAMDSVFIDTYTCITTDLSADVLHAPLSKYLRVCLKELGIRISQQHQIKKKLAHRKQVLLEEVTGLPPTKKQKTIPEAATSTSSNPQHTSSAVTPAEDTEEQTYYCSVCGAKYVSGTRFNWIECSSCEKWSHRKCDPTLKKPKAWLHAQKDGVEYNCPPCKTKWIESYICMGIAHFLWFACKVPHLCTCFMTSTYFSPEDLCWGALEEALLHHTARHWLFWIWVFGPGWWMEWCSYNKTITLLLGMVNGFQIFNVMLHYSCLACWGT